MLIGFASGVRLPPMRLILLLGLIHMTLAACAPRRSAGDRRPAGAGRPARPRPRRTDRRTASIADRRLVRPLGAAGRHPGGWRWQLAIAAVLALPTVLAPIVRGDDLVTPAAALAAAQRLGLAGPVLNSEPFGGYLVFRGVPSFIDGRDRDVRQRFPGRGLSPPSAATPALNELLARYRIAWTLADADLRRRRGDGRPARLGAGLRRRSRDHPSPLRPGRALTRPARRAPRIAAPARRERCVALLPAASRCRPSRRLCRADPASLLCPGQLPARCRLDRVPGLAWRAAPALSEVARRRQLLQLACLADPDRVSVCCGGRCRCPTSSFSRRLSAFAMPCRRSPCSGSCARAIGCAAAGVSAAALVAVAFAFNGLALAIARYPHSRDPDRRRRHDVCCRAGRCGGPASRGLFRRRAADPRGCRVSPVRSAVRLSRVNRWYGGPGAQQRPNSASRLPALAYSIVVLAAQRTAVDRCRRPWRSPISASAVRRPARRRRCCCGCGSC